MNHENAAEVEESRTEAERIRDLFFYQGKWHTPNNAELPQHRGLLLAGIEEWETRVAELQATKDAKQKAYDTASVELRTAATDLSGAIRSLDIYKLALADEMGILK